MPLDLEPFGDVGLSEPVLEALLGEHASTVEPELERLWRYYRNPVEFARVHGGIAGSARSSGGRHAQESGLPARLRGRTNGALTDDRAAEREVVIENDIGWRVEAMVDFVFGKPMRILSTAADANKRREIEMILDAVWEASGGIALLQDMALLGAVFGHVDLLLRFDELFESARRLRSGSGQVSIERAVELARRLRIEGVEARRGVPMLDPNDFRRILAYVIRSDVQTNDVESGASVSGVMSRVLERITGRTVGVPQRRRGETLEILSAQHRQMYVDGELVDETENALGVLPIVHVQNASQPFVYEGLSDVEALIPIQDELNTRLSDRAHRVTMQSFNMYLAKGLEGIGQDGNLRVGPGQVWQTDNPDASVEAFGGDGNSPSEEQHIEQLRDAMDKISGVSPVAIGVIRARLGHLSSENALRIALMGVISKTARKRVSYGRGISEMSQLVLRALDAAGVYRTSAAEQGVRLEWRDPLPVDERSKLRGALMKVELGVPREEVLDELGYGSGDAGVT